MDTKIKKEKRGGNGYNTNTNMMKQPEDGHEKEKSTNITCTQKIVDWFACLQKDNVTIGKPNPNITTHTHTHWQQPRNTNEQSKRSYSDFV